MKVGDIDKEKLRERKKKENMENIERLINELRNNEIIEENEECF